MTAGHLPRSDLAARSTVLSEPDGSSAPDAAAVVDAALPDEPADPSRAPRLRDIARLAGVSQSTVSRVLNNTETAIPIAPRTRERVLAAAREAGYRPNPLARALRGAPTMLLGVLVRDFGDPFFAAAIDVLAAEAMENGYNLVLGHAHGRQGRSTSLAATLETRQTDAIILLGDVHDQPRLLADLKASPVPVVATWQGISPIDFPTVDIDDAVGMRLGLEHLVGLGHRRIAMVSARLPLDNPNRENLYLSVMQEHFGGVPDGYLQRVPNSLEGGEQALEALLALPDPPTAAVASTDLAAVGVLHRAWALGRPIPHDLSVVGYDDLYLAAYTVPALTTVQMPMQAIVRAAVRWAIDLARDTSAERELRTLRFKPSLIVRQSTAAPAR